MNDLPPWLQVLYPFKGNSFESAEGSMNYVDEGSGPPMVFLHGNPTWSFFYRDLILELREKHRCLALDHLGCGLSEKPQEATYTLAAHVDRTVAWLESLALEDFHLVVHDWGGAIGFGAADRLREKVRCITVLNTAAFSFPTLPKRIAACRIPLLGSLMVRGGNAFVEAATHVTTVSPLADAVKEAYRFPYDNWNNRIAVDRFVKDIPMGPRHSSWTTLQSISKSLEYWKNQPVQIVWGMQDWCFHKGILTEWEQRLPQARVHRLRNAGHYLIEDDGSEVRSLVKSFDRMNS